MSAAVKQDKLNAAADVLSEGCANGQIHAASLYVQQGENVFARSFGVAKSVDDVFLLASISKPISAAAVMTLYDDGKFGLDDKVHKYIPEFTGDGVAIRSNGTHQRNQGYANESQRKQAIHSDSSKIQIRKHQGQSTGAVSTKTRELRKTGAATRGRRSCFTVG